MQYRKYNWGFITSLVKVAQSCLTLGNPMFYTVHGILQARILEVGSLSLLQGIFPIQGSNPDLPHCRWILYQLSHQGGPRILAWVAYPFCRGLPDPGIELGSPALQVNSLPAELPGKPPNKQNTNQQQYSTEFRQNGVIENGRVLILMAAHSGKPI